jgi:hypothetical protein
MTSDPPGRPSGEAGAGSDSPWSRDSAGEIEVSWKAPSGAPAPQSSRAGAPQSSPAGAPPEPRPGGGAAAADIVASGPEEDDEPAFGGIRVDRRRMLLWSGFAGGGAVLAAIVLIVVLVSTGFFGDASRSGVGPIGGIDPQPSAPPLARLCPPPTGSAPRAEELPVPDGARVTDSAAGISYAQLSAPWIAWDRGTWSDGTLGVEFREGYYFITEEYSGGTYLASVLSGKVPATVGDSLSLNLECAGKQVAEDVRNSYYPRPNQKEETRTELATVGGRPAWVSTFHLAFQAEGLKARGETVAVVLIDVGKPDAAVLYLSVPDTHKQFAADIDKVVESVRPL